MFTVIGFGLVVVLALFFALRRLGRDDTAPRRMRRNEYNALVKYIWHQ